MYLQVGVQIDLVALASGTIAGVAAYVLSHVFRPLLPNITHAPPRKHTGVLPFLLQYAYELANGSPFSLDPIFCRWSKQKAITYRLLCLHQIMLFEQNDIDHVMVSNHRNYIPGLGYSLIKKILGDGLLTVFDADEHSVHRRIVSPAFSPSALKRISAETISDHAIELHDAILREVQGGTKEVSIQKIINRTAMNIIADAAFHTSKEDMDEIATRMQRMHDAGINFLQFMPLLDRIPTRGLREAEAFQHQLDGLVMKLVTRIRSGEMIEGNGRSIIDYLVQSKELNPEQIRGHSLTFMFAGFDTSSNSLQWNIALLAQHPDVQQQLYEELCETIAKGITPDPESIRTCPTLQKVIRESMRMMPVGSGLSRVALKDDVLPFSKVVVPAGSHVVVSIIGAHRNEYVYGPDANEFRPSRWDDPTLADRVGDCGWIPFSVGPRGCIGKEFAWNEVMVLLALIIRNFKIDFAAGQSFPVERRGIVVFPEAYRVMMTARER